MKRTFITIGLATLALAVFLPTGIRAQEEEGCEEGCCPPPIPWEHIHDHYRNLRGFNFIPEYPSLMSYSAPGVWFERETDFRGVASPTAMWHFYDKLPIAAPQGHESNGSLSPTEDLLRQLNAIRGSGANTLRVWLSFPAWMEAEEAGGPNQFIENFKNFLTLCEERHIYVMPILWDMVGFKQPQLEVEQGLPNPLPAGWPDPSYPQVAGQPEGVNNLTDILQHWHANPGNVYVDQFIPEGTFSSPATSQPDEDLYPLFDTYIRAVVQAGKDSPALLMWDAMNEPRIVGTYKANAIAFLKETLRIIKDEDEDQVTVIGFQTVSPALDEGAASNDPVLGWPNLDVIGTQLYCYTRIRPEAVVAAAEFRKLITPTNDLKPIIAVEIGASMFEQYALDFITGVKRTDIGPDPITQITPHGMGFVLFQGIVGLRYGQFPYKETSGMFFWNGQVRSIADAEALRDFSDDEGATNILTTTFLHPAPDSIFGWMWAHFRDETTHVEEDLYDVIFTDTLGADYDLWTEPAYDDLDITRHVQTYLWMLDNLGKTQIEQTVLLSEPFTWVIADRYLQGVTNPYGLNNYSDLKDDFDDAMEKLTKHLNGTQTLGWTQRTDQLVILRDVTDTWLVMTGNIGLYN